MEIHLQKRQSLNDDRINLEASSAYACVNLGKKYSRVLKEGEIIIQLERDVRAVKTARVPITQKEVQVKN
ncbi:MAG: hypothetical protein H7X84_09765 [Verrucomicrobia bacterium]|nr:hypothetical protein [Prolixibacteraceae bacterium]